jgi:hypothetical protein
VSEDMPQEKPKSKLIQEKLNAFDLQDKILGSDLFFLLDFHYWGNFWAFPYALSP